MKTFAIALAIAFVALAAHARVFMTQQEALAAAFPAGAKVTRQTFFLTKQQIDDAQRESGVRFDQQLVIRYMGTTGDKTAGFAYFDTHRVRTEPETVMVVVTPDGRIDRIDILSFEEPTDYFPKKRWVDQILGRKLDNELSLNKAIRPLSGASLTGQAIVNASRKILALHHVIR
jgi:FMN-binding protein